MRFSVRERIFQRDFFNPYHKGNTEFQYNEQLNYFIVSVLWRIAISGINHSVPQGSNAYEKLQQLKEEWRNLLYSNGTTTITSSQHVYLADDLEKVFVKAKKEKRRLYSYFMRILDICVLSDGDNLIIYAKLPGILLLSYVVLSCMTGSKAVTQIMYRE